MEGGEARKRDTDREMRIEAERETDEKSYRRKKNINLAFRAPLLKISLCFEVVLSPS